MVDVLCIIMTKSVLREVPAPEFFGRLRKTLKDATLPRRA